MSSERMHADERDIDIDIALVRRLLESQFGEWSGLPVTPVASSGTDHALFRLGPDMVVRLPRIDSATGQVLKEQRWLPVLGPQLPLAIPVPLATGMPSGGYPWRWSVYRWLEGETVAGGRITDPLQAASALGGFVRALRGIDPAGGPAPGEHNFFRGEPLSLRDKDTRDSIAVVGDLVEIDAATSAWDAALRAPAWDRPPTWIHGDLHAENLLLRQGRVSAVVDFGGLAVGDPACDIMAGWTVLDAGSRPAFRAAAQVDDATWARGRGWALSVALVMLPYYRSTNPVLTAHSLRWIDEVLTDPQ